MKVLKKANNRLEDNNDFLIDITIRNWFNNRLEEVVASGDNEKIEKYKKINIEKSFKLFNTAHFRKTNYLRSTIVSREVGICFPDPKLKFLKFTDFLTNELDPNKEIYLNENYPEELTIDSLQQLLSDTDTYPSSPNIYLVNSGSKLALLYFCNDSNYLTPSYLHDKIFKQYKFNKIETNISQKDLNEYPEGFYLDLEYLKVGTIKVTDKVLKEYTIDINVYDVKFIDDLMNGTEYPMTFSGAVSYNSAISYNGRA